MARKTAASTSIPRTVPPPLPPVTVKQQTQKQQNDHEDTAYSQSAEDTNDVLLSTKENGPKTSVLPGQEQKQEEGEKEAAAHTPLPLDPSIGAGDHGAAEGGRKGQGGAPEQEENSVVPVLSKTEMVVRTKAARKIQVLYCNLFLFNEKYTVVVWF